MRRVVRARRPVGALLAALAVLSASLTVAGAARADDPTVSYDNLRTGWDPNESGLAPSNVAAADFGQLYGTQLDGQIYAQPVVAKSTVLAVTENDKAYGLNPQTGAVTWTRDVGPSWPASAIGCGDLAPNVGITSTPAYDATTGTAYFMAKVNDGADTNHPHWYLHAVDITSGVERAGFPRTITGAPTNDPSHPFNAKTAMQRPGLLLLGGVVYAGFASHCDDKPYVGYVVGVNAATGKQTTMWATEVGSSSSEAGIWQSGGGLVSDGPGQILFTTGNGVSAPPGPGKTPPTTLAEAVVRVQVGADGNLTATDFFSPVNNTNLDTNDADLGAGGPIALPDSAGTAAHPHLLVQCGKDGRVFLLDRDDLGGVGQGPGGTDDVLQTAGPYDGQWGHPAFWGGDGGYVYLIGNGGPLRAFKVGVAGNGLPSLSSVGTSSSAWGYTSGSPVVTSSGSTSGSALVWAVYASGPNGSGGQLRAYDAVPDSGVMTLRYSAPIGTAAKFAVPATDGGRVFVGTRDGVLYGFGRPTTVALSGSPTDFGSVPVGTTATKNVTVTATRTVTVTAVGATAPFGVGASSLPVTLTSGQTLTVPATFRPTVAASTSGSISFTTNLGTLAFDLHGSGTQAGLAASPASVAFGDVPVTGTVTVSINVTNTGTATTTITGSTPPAAPFSAGSLPVTGSTLAAGASVSVPITFRPTATGAATSSVTVRSGAGAVVIPLSGNGVAGASHLTLNPTDVDFGTVPVGSTATRTFDISNTGNLLLTITKAAPPAAPFGVAVPVSEGQQLEPGDVIHQTVTFTPTAAGTSTGQYLITGNDNHGAQAVTVHGIGAGSAPPGTIPAPSAGGWTANGSAVQSGADTVLTPATANLAGSMVYPVPVSTTGLHVTFTARSNGGTGADGLTFALLDAASNSPTSLGKPGGALGFGSLTGVAVALDTHKNGNDPSGNFVGVANGATGAGSASLTYVAHLTPTTSLRAGTHLVDVTVAPTDLTIRLDGGPALIATVSVPPTAYLAFTAGTGGRTDVHSVSAVTITHPVVTGAIVGIAAKCVDVLGAKTANNTPVDLRTCDGSSGQRWTVAAGNTLRSLGKCLDVRNAGTADPTPVQLYGCNGTPAQVWVPQSNGELLNPHSELCLTDPGSNTADGTHLVVSACNADTDQMWRLPTG